MSDPADICPTCGQPESAPPMPYVWAIVYGNYEPPEVRALYDNEAAAREHVDQLDGDWGVVRWAVQSTAPSRDEEPSDAA